MHKEKGYSFDFIYFKYLFSKTSIYHWFIVTYWVIKCITNLIIASHKNFQRIRIMLYFLLILLRKKVCQKKCGLDICISVHCTVYFHKRRRCMNWLHLSGSLIIGLPKGMIREKRFYTRGTVRSIRILR